jgi:acyl carrier protein
MPPTDDVLARLQQLLREVFGDDTLVVSDATTADDVDGWDSLMHVNIIIAIEKRFGVKFAAAEIASLKGEGQNLGTFRQLLTRKLASAKAPPG